LNIILQEPKGIQMLTRLANLGTLTAIHEAIVWDNEVKTRLNLAIKSDPEPEWELDKALDGYPLTLALAYTLWFMKLSRVNAASVTGRLRIPGWLTKVILAACKPLYESPEMADGPPSAIVAQVEGVPPLALYAHFLVARDKRVKQNIINYITKWRAIRPITSGHDLRERGIPPGPEYRRILDGLRAAWLDGLVTSHEAEIDLLNELLSKATSG
jgi:tRNA nucleotidyltransferase (CCA-adding enzyme)